MIFYNCFLTLFGAKITAVTINDFFLSCKEVGRHCYIVNIHRSGFNSKHHPFRYAIYSQNTTHFPCASDVRRSHVWVPYF